MKLIKSYPFLAKKIFASNFRRLDFPYKLTFALTYKCNGRCMTCNIWKRKPQNELTTEEVVKFFSRNNRFAWIDLTGGEIFLRDDLPEIVKAILSNCGNLCLLHFPTNGLLTSKIVSFTELFAGMKNSARMIITVSIDGDEELNDKIRGVKGGWKHQIETFKALRGIRGVKAVLGMTLSQYNYDKFEKAFSAAKEVCPWLTYEDFHVNIAHVSSHYYGNEDLHLDKMPKEDVISQVSKYMAYRGIPFGPVGFLEREYLKRVDKFLSTGKTPIHCHALRSSCFIDPTGNVFPCGMYDKVVGSLRENDYDLSKIWNVEATSKLQEEIWNFKCPQCWTPCEAYQSILGSLFRMGK